MKTPWPYSQGHPPMYVCQNEQHVHGRLHACVQVCERGVMETLACRTFEGGSRGPTPPC